MNRHLSDTFRKNYASANPRDELAFYLGIEFDDRLRMKATCEGRQIDASEVNHIWSNPRRDVRSNLIDQTRRSHAAFHANLPLGRLLCMLAKARKSARICEPFEFVIADLDLCAGRSVAGWLECQTYPEQWQRDFQSELLRRITQAKESVA